MNSIVLDRIKQAQNKSLEDEMALIREIIQELALLGLWRSKFYEKACFYGGTALRILHGLERFSEDLDFSLLKPDPEFDIMKYEGAIKKELQSFGFEVEIVSKIKKISTNIQSAFIKANTLVHLLKVSSSHKTHRDSLFKIKIEVDKDPPPGFTTETQSVFWPLAFYVKTFSLPDLFAGKMHACLCRSERNNIKGRDWFDFLWYVSRKTPLNLEHLQHRMQQSKHLSAKTPLDLKTFHRIYEEKISSIDFNLAKQDLRPLLKDFGSLEAWSYDLFKDAGKQILIA